MTEELPDDPFVIIDTYDTKGKPWTIYFEVDQIEHMVKQLRHRVRIMQRGDTCCVSGTGESVVLVGPKELTRIVRELEKAHDERKL